MNRNCHLYLSGSAPHAARRLQTGLLSFFPFPHDFFSSLLCVGLLDTSGNISRPYLSPRFSFLDRMGFLLSPSRSQNFFLNLVTGLIPLPLMQICVVFLGALVTVFPQGPAQSILWLQSGCLPFYDFYNKNRLPVSRLFFFFPPVNPEATIFSSLNHFSFSCLRSSGPCTRPSRFSALPIA